MNKSQLIDFVAEKTNIAKVTVSIVISEMHDVIAESLQKGDSVKIPGFGTFTSKKEDDGKVKNCKAGERINIPPVNVVNFESSQELKEKINA